jgi:hypothetical protein
MGAILSCYSTTLFMDNELSVIADFVKSNRKALASYVRQNLVAANAKPYLDRLGKEGAEALDRDAAGVLLDLACALLRRLHPERDFQSEEILAHLPEDIRQSIRLPRSEAFHAVLAQLQKGNAGPAQSG